MSEKKTVNEILHLVQMEIKAPKGQYNSFGKYKYRKCEDILEAAKKVMPSGATLCISDTLLMIGDRYYVKATATFTYENSSIECHAYAREEETKKGMDASQITGSASSYARKYALNGLLAIDDTEDADSPEESKIERSRPAAKPELPKQTINEEQAMILLGLLKDAEKDLSRMLSFYQIEKIQDFPLSSFDYQCGQLKKVIEKAKGEK